MKKCFALTVLLVIACGQVWANHPITERAHDLYRLDKKDQAYHLYLKAGAAGDPDGYFYAAYRYVLTDDKSVYFYTKAAEQGHEKALEQVLDRLFFRVGDLVRSNPEKALRIYHKAKQKNPSLNIYNENEYKTMQKCVEAGKLDISDFLTLQSQNENTIYNVWQMAEAAANTKQFGKPNVHLALQLVCRGSVVPAEVQSAVAELYQLWKAGDHAYFNICDHISSRDGAHYCETRTRK